MYDDADKENQKNQKNQRYLEIAAKISQVREFARVCQGEGKSGSSVQAVERMGSSVKASAAAYL